MAPPRYVPLRVLDVVTETADARSFVLEVPADERDAFAYRAGQYCTFKVATDRGEQLRCYSMSSSPDVDEPFRTTVKRVPEGIVSNWLIDRIVPGDVLLATPPAGVFCLDADDRRPVVAFAGGSGITPVASIVKTALVATERPVHLLFANRDSGSVILGAELDQLAADHPDRFTLLHHRDDERGFLDPGEVAAFLGAELDVAVYLCGPTPFMDLVEAALVAAGHDPALVRTERFVLADAAVPDGDASDEVTADAVALTVTLGGTTAALDHRAGETILEAARRGGLQPPFSCQAGNCATCMAELLEGGVEMRVNDVLRPDEVADGWILTCQSLPTTTEVRVAWPD